MSAEKHSLAGVVCRVTDCVRTGGVASVTTLGGDTSAAAVVGVENACPGVDASTASTPGDRILSVSGDPGLVVPSRPSKGEWDHADAGAGESLATSGTSTASPSTMTGATGTRITTPASLAGETESADRGKP